MKIHTQDRTATADTAPQVPGFRPVPRTGVIYVMHRAAQLGYRADSPDWANLGQGSPESGPLAGAPQRLSSMRLEPQDHAYAPVGGLARLRQRVAELYNRTFRGGRRSQYTAENVCIAPGGRAAMARVVASLAPMNLGHFIPDYTAYEELLFTFRGFIPIPILLDAADRYSPSAANLRHEIVGRGLSAVLCSNPCNPTGQVVSGDDLAAWIEVARDCRCTSIFDEFYSHYLYSSRPGGEAAMISAASWVDDVDRDPVVIVDGLTKNWRYPGWRVSWIVGPRSVIEQAISAGSFLDGGANRPFQEAAITLLDPDHTRQETIAIQNHFHRKRRLMLDGLAELGIDVEVEPDGAFYCWANLHRLSAPLDDGHRFFEAALRQRVITVPGVFFDVNPGRRRTNARYQSYVRFSFGPPIEELELGLDGLRRLLERR